MDDKTYLGALAESKVIAALTEQRWHVFSQLSGKAPFDLVVSKNDKLYRIDVKSSTVVKSGSYLVRIGRVRSNKTKNTIYKFDNKNADILAVYLVLLDKVVFIPTQLIKTGRELSLREELSTHGKNTTFLIKNYESLK